MRNDSSDKSQATLFKERAYSRFQKDKNAKDFVSRSSSNKIPKASNHNYYNISHGYSASNMTTGKKKNLKSIGLKSSAKKKLKSVRESIFNPEKNSISRTQSY